jgi:hypothetical protein
MKSKDSHSFSFYMVLHYYFYFSKPSFSFLKNKLTTMTIRIVKIAIYAGPSMSLRHRKLCGTVSQLASQLLSILHILLTRRGRRILYCCFCYISYFRVTYLSISFSCMSVNSVKYSVAENKF